MDTFPQDLKPENQSDLDDIIYDFKTCRFRKILALYYYRHYLHPNFGFSHLLELLPIDDDMVVILTKKFAINGNWNVICTLSSNLLKLKA